MSLENVVAEHQRTRVPCHEFGAYQKSLRQAAGVGLHCVGQFDPPLRPVAQQPLD